MNKEAPGYRPGMTEVPDDSPASEGGIERGEKRVARKRMQTVAVGPWWAEEIQQRMAEDGVRAAELAKLCGVSHSSITRVLNGETPTVPLMLRISKLFKVPSPVWVAASLGEAMAFARARERYSADQTIAQVEAVVERKETGRSAAPTGQAPARRRTRSTSRQ